MKRGIVRIIALLLLCFAFQPTPASANEKISVAVSQSRLFNISGVERVAVANPEVADVLVVSGSEVLIVGKQPGVTTLHIWSAAGRGSYDVEVGTNDTQIANDIKAILGYPDIRVSKVGKNVILEGGVNDQYQKLRAEKVAGAYGEKVVNLLEIVRPVQVKIEARVIEINRSKTDNLGIKWGNDPTNPGTFRAGQTPQKDWKVTYGDGSSGYVYNNALIDSKPYGKTWGGHGGYWDVNAQLDALVKQGLAKILSQPNVITLSGEKANILVGGEIPIPIAMLNGAISVEWKQFGIKLEISPEVNSEGLINSKIKAEVSTVDWSSDHKIGLSQNFQIPPINTRRAEASIALSSGQTMALGGLIASETLKDVTKVPGLADIPILGKLFTSKSFSRHETELVILITPTIVDPREYVPGMTTEMKDMVKEDPYADGQKKNAPGGKRDGGKD
ncbi:type II and III secretion system protein family protein [Anaeroselena agilis]|uniref:Pilus assembly protein N-terminal domain-containing protein n=1 Tax=Anaeroselena agilis TaxID=3063788 RepID=A0ABU3P3R6_9FIRM|nr:pilus assembly protein N-terminal domain-containing protein [Selenomonadales bacterium 4137-cl]